MSTPTIQRVKKTLPSHHTSRSAAFKHLYTDPSSQFRLDLTTVDRLLQQNDQELIIEVICIMLDWLSLPLTEREQDTTGYKASYDAIINRLGINLGAIPLSQEYLAPLLALLPDGASGAAGTPCRRELADIVRILRTSTNWTSATFLEAVQSSSWQSAYTDLSELYAVSVASDIRIENLHYGKLFELLFFKTKGKENGEEKKNTVEKKILKKLKKVKNLKKVQKMKMKMQLMKMLKMKMPKLNKKLLILLVRMLLRLILKRVLMNSANGLVSPPTANLPPISSFPPKLNKFHIFFAEWTTITQFPQSLGSFSVLSSINNVI